MKNFLIIFFVLVSQISEAAWLSSFEEAQKMSLATNKFIIVDFWATWCGPCKKMDSDSWSNQEVKNVLEDYIQVKVDIDTNRDLANKYGIQSIPNMFIMDGNGKVVYSFLGYHDATQLRKELEKFAISTEYLSNDLINFYKTNNYNTATRVSQKWFDYSLLVENRIKRNILDLSDLYLSDAKKMLSKKDKDYLEKKQKVDLLELYRYAYGNNYSKLDKKLTNFKESEINESNVNFYYFLKYLSAKALKKDTFISIEEKTKVLEGFDYFVKKADLIISQQV